MKTTTTLAMTACAFVALTLAAPVSAGLQLNGPALDGQKVSLPTWLAGTPEAAFDGDGLHLNGPALDGQKLALPGGPVHARR